MSSKDFDHQIGKNQVKHDQLKASMEKGDSIRLSSTDQKDDSLIHFGRFGTEQITDQTSPKAKVKKSKSLATLLRKVSRDVLGRDPVMSQVTDQLVTSLDEQKMDSVAGPGTEGPIFCTPGQSEIIRVPLEIINDTELAEGIQGSKTLDSVLQKDWDGLNEAGEFRKVFGNSYESDYHNPFPFLDTDASLEHSKKSVVKPIQVQSATTLSVLAGSRAERSDIFASPASASQLKKKQIAVYHDQHPVIHHIEDAYRTINFGLRTKTTSKLPLHQRASTPSHAVSTSNIESSCHPNNTADMDSVTFLGPKRANTEVSCDSGTSHNQIPSMVDSTRALEMIASVVVPREESKVSNVSEMPLSVADSAVRAIDVEAFSVKRNSMPSISDCNTGIAETGNTKKNHKKNGRKKVKARSTATEDGSTTSTVEGSPIDVKASKQAVFLEKIKKDHHTKYKEHELRENTSTHPVLYSKDDPTPKHPSHHRTWFSKNLWCMDCKTNCGVCGDVCCVMVGLIQLSGDNNTTVEEKLWAENLAHEIQLWTVRPKELTTFLQCTTCKNWACPDCSGICPNIEICQDRMCAGCKPNPLEKCDWHD